jgi:hypothetical protein
MMLSYYVAVILVAAALTCVPIAAGWLVGRLYGFLRGTAVP